MRKVSEWFGRTDDSKVPKHVRLRIFEREGGICHLSGIKIGPGDKWDLDHKIALCNGGEHRESNLFPALQSKHRLKTAQDVAERAKTHAMRMKHLGIKEPSRGFYKPKGTKYNWKSGRYEREVTE